MAEYPVKQGEQNRLTPEEERELEKQEEVRRTARRIALDILNLTRNGLFVALRFMDVALCQFTYINAEDVNLPFDIRTVATTGDFLIYDPQYIIENYLKDKKALSRDYMHIVLHCVFRHPFVSTKLDRSCWNLASDIAVEAVLCDLDIRQADVRDSAEIKKEIDRIRKKVRQMNAEHLYRWLLSGEVSERDIQRWKNLFHRDEHAVWWEIARQIEEEKKKKAEEEAARQDDNTRSEEVQPEDPEETEENPEEESEENESDGEDGEESEETSEDAESDHEDENASDDASGNDESDEEGEEESEESSSQEDEEGPEDDFSEGAEADEEEDDFPDDEYEDEYSSTPGGDKDGPGDDPMGDPDSDTRESEEESSGEGEGGGNPGDDPEASDEEGADRPNDASSDGLSGSDDGHQPEGEPEGGELDGQMDEGVPDSNQEGASQDEAQQGGQPKSGGKNEKHTSSGSHSAGTGGSGSRHQSAWEHDQGGETGRGAGEEDPNDRQRLNGGIDPDSRQDQLEGDGKEDAQAVQGTADSGEEDLDKPPAFMHSGEEQEELENKWKEISERMLVDIETSSKEWGDRSDSMVQGIRKINRDKYDYRTFLQKFSTLREDIQINDDEFDYVYYTFGMERYGNMPLIEPLEYKEVRKVRDFVIAIDTSGSCAGEVVQKFLDKTYSIFSQQENFFRKINLHIIQCDSQIQSDVKITSKEEFSEYMKVLDFKGFGGTDFRPVFEYVNELQEQHEFDDLKGLIYFTDGNGIYPRKRPPFETAFIFVDDDEFDYEVPSWAMKLVLETSDIMEEVLL